MEQKILDCRAPILIFENLNYFASEFDSNLLQLYVETAIQKAEKDPEVVSVLLNQLESTLQKFDGQIPAISDALENLYAQLPDENSTYTMKFLEVVRLLPQSSLEKISCLDGDSEVTRGCLNNSNIIP